MLDRTRHSDYQDMTNPYAPPKTSSSRKSFGALTRLIWRAAILHSSETGMFQFTLAVLCLLTGIVYLTFSTICFLELRSVTLAREFTFYAGCGTMCLVGVILCFLAMRAWWRENVRTAAVLSAVLAVATAFVVVTIT